MQDRRENRTPSLSKYVYAKRYVAVMLILAIVVLLLVGAALVWVSFERAHTLPYFLLRETGKAILITVLVSTAITWYFTYHLSILEKEKQESERQIQQNNASYQREKDELFRETVNTQLDVLRKGVLSQTKQIATEAVCFDALQAADVDRFYRSRDEASESIRDALLQNGVTIIRLIGVSLNDFMRDEHTDLHDAWMAIRKYVEEDTTPTDASTLDIRVLVIDPRSQGAYFRAKAEGTEGAESRLCSDVKDTMRDLLELEETVINSTQQQRRVTFAARVYKTCPVLFLVWTPNTAFVQPYHFRPRHTKSRIPIIKYHNSGELDCLHQELGFHFDWIWENASVTLNEHMNMSCVGIADAVRDANIANMYYDYAESRARIITLIEQSKEILWIKGISLHSYFTFARDELFQAIADAYERGVDVRILLIDPNSEQARLRSFREYLMSHPTSQLEHFDQQARAGERLFTDTGGSINFINLQLRRRIKSNTDLNVRLYNSGPDCFTLLTDAAVLIEQYHYGKIETADESRPGLILGGDVPVIEYKRIPESQIADKKKNPYQLFKNSFEYVFKHCSMGLDEYRDSGT